MKAAELEKQKANKKKLRSHALADGQQTRVTLVAGEDDDNAETEILPAQIVGHKFVWTGDETEQPENRVLILPLKSSNKDSRGGSDDGDDQEAFWAVLQFDSGDHVLKCSTLDSTPTVYRIEQFDYDASSAAFQECLNIVAWLKRQAKAEPFMQPVDPVALGVPHYFNIVKCPMDISTLEENLENGKYSTIPPGTTIGKTPVSRMLNGPFRRDLLLIFENAILFNPPDDWIHQAALVLKKAAIKKIADASSAADDNVVGEARSRQAKGMYFEEDSDVDMYDFESDRDEDYSGTPSNGRGRKKRKRPNRNGAKPDDYPSRAIENQVRLQSVLRHTSGLRGPFSDLPVRTDAMSFGLPDGWKCRHPRAKRTDSNTSKPESRINGNALASSDAGSALNNQTDDDEAERSQRMQDMMELLELQQEMEAVENMGKRRSARGAYGGASSSSSSKNKSGKAKKKDGDALEIVEFYFDHPDGDGTVAGDDAEVKCPRNRYEIERERERLHDDHYAKLYQLYSSSVVLNHDGDEAWGMYANGSFPPYMGRVIAPYNDSGFTTWEIRNPFIVPAVRWVIRGLIESGHLTAVEPVTADAFLSSGVVVTNDIYYWDASLQPFEVLDLKGLQRRKRAGATAAQEDSDSDDVEMSAYERMRAERVARNAERLKLLGL